MAIFHGKMLVHQRVSLYIDPYKCHILHPLMPTPGWEVRHLRRAYSCSSAQLPGAATAAQRGA